MAPRPAQNESVSLNGAVRSIAWLSRSLSKCDLLQGSHAEHGRRPHCGPDVLYQNVITLKSFRRLDLHAILAWGTALPFCPVWPGCSVADVHGGVKYIIKTLWSASGRSQVRRGADCEALLSRRGPILDVALSYVHYACPSLLASLDNNSHPTSCTLSGPSLKVYFDRLDQVRAQAPRWARAGTCMTCRICDNFMARRLFSMFSSVDGRMLRGTVSNHVSLFECSAVDWVSAFNSSADVPRQLVSELPVYESQHCQEVQNFIENTAVKLL